MSKFKYLLWISFSSVLVSLLFQNCQGVGSSQGNFETSSSVQTVQNTNTYRMIASIESGGVPRISVAVVDLPSVTVYGLSNGTVPVVMTYPAVTVNPSNTNITPTYGLPPDVSPVIISSNTSSSSVEPIFCAGPSCTSEDVRRSRVMQKAAPVPCVTGPAYWGMDIAIYGSDYREFVAAFQRYPYEWTQPKTACNNANEGKVLKVTRSGTTIVDKYVCVADKFYCASGSESLVYMDRYISGTSPVGVLTETALKTDKYHWVYTAATMQKIDEHQKRYGYTVTDGGDLNGQNCYMEELNKVKVTGAYSREVVCTKGEFFKPQASCGANWPQMGVFTCKNGIQYQKITGCNPEGYQDPRLWVNEGGGVYSHMTGRGCTSTNFVGDTKLPLPQ